MLKKAAGTLIVLSCVACGGKSDEATEKPPLGPGVGVLELPVSLRTGDPAQNDFRKLEVGLSDVRADEQAIVPLENGKVPAAERSGDVLPKLQSALGSPARSGVALRVHASVPYETLALVLNTISRSGMHKVAFEVRNPGGSTSTGWLKLSGFQMTPRTDGDVPFAGADPRKWDDFSKEWQAIYDACRAAKTGSCAYVETNVAKGGNLKMVLHASGQGVNLNFYRTGLTPEELAAEEKTRMAELAMKKEDIIQGRVAQKDLVGELTDAAPASQALFQFRASEAVEAPSALTQVMQPLCGPRACGAVVSADSHTLTVRVISLIGAAFADGGAAPTLAFEMPWTEKPKAPTPAPSEAAPAP